MLEYDANRLKDPYLEPYFSPVKAKILERWTRLVAAVDPDVEMGFHLYYGDVRHMHFIEPEDLGLLVDLANSIIRDIPRIHPIWYFHMPVPKDRTDEQYFKPLQDLKLDGTKLLLGLFMLVTSRARRRGLRQHRRRMRSGLGWLQNAVLGGHLLRKWTASSTS